MLSLSNAFHWQEVAEWGRRLPGGAVLEEPLFLEPKVDGLAVSLTYVDGSLRTAATRGDGTTGEEVTAQARTIRNIPLVLQGESVPPLVTVRGEVYMPRSAFHQYNQEREERGEAPLSNPRNGEAGALRQQDPSETARRPLSFVAYAWADPPPDVARHSDALERLQEMGLPVNGANRSCRTVTELQREHTRLMNNRDALDYEADGLVIKVDSLETRRYMGETSHDPRWAIAWKFPAERAETRLLSIAISPGRFGKLTPVAVLEAVTVGGVNITSASLHNEADVRRKNIRAGARVIVERAGDVIPQVVGPADDRETARLPVFRMSEYCPSCQSPVDVREKEAGHWCPNEECPSRLPEQLRSFVARDAMDIEGIGATWCQQIASQGLVSNTAGLYGRSE